MGAASRSLKVLGYERVHWSLVCPVGEVAHHSLLGIVVTLPVLCLLLALLSAIFGLAEAAAGVSVAVGSQGVAGVGVSDDVVGVQTEAGCPVFQNNPGFTPRPGTEMLVVSKCPSSHFKGHGLTTNYHC